jgi:uncharacterized protein involved in exopolysaccharide biosynthesis
MSNQEIILSERRSQTLASYAPFELIEVGIRRRRTLGACFLALFIGACLAAVVLPKRYESELKILVHRERADPIVTSEQTAAVQQNLPSLSEEDINSEVAILRSQDLLEKVVVRCGLEKQTSGQFWSKWIHQDSPDAQDREHAIRAASIKLGNDLRIEPIKKSYVISVKYSASDPELAARVLNALGDLYLEKHAKVHRPNDAYQFFDTQTKQYHEQMEAAEQRLAEFNEKEGLVTAQSEKDDAVPRLAEFELSMRQTQASIPEIRERIASLQSLLAKTPPRITTQLHTSDNGGLLQQLRSNLVTLQTQETDLMNKYAPGDRMVQEVKTQIKQVQAAIDAQEKSPLKQETTDQNPTYEYLRQELAKARADLASQQALSTSLAKVNVSYKQAVIDRDQKQLEQQNLIRDAKAAESNYLLYLNKKEEARISDAFDRSRILNVSIAEPALPAIRPTNPASLILMIGAILALLISSCIVLVQERLDSSLRTPDQLESYLSVPVLASLPRDVGEPHHLPL